MEQKIQKRKKINVLDLWKLARMIGKKDKILYKVFPDNELLSDISTFLQQILFDIYGIPSNSSDYITNDYWLDLFWQFTGGEISKEKIIQDFESSREYIEKYIREAKEDEKRGEYQDVPMVKIRKVAEYAGSSLDIVKQDPGLLKRAREAMELGERYPEDYNELEELKKIKKERGDGQSDIGTCWQDFNPRRLDCQWCGGFNQCLDFKIHYLDRKKD